MKTDIKDMTTGSPIKLLLLFSLPMLIGNIIQQFYTIVDSMIVGQYLGSDALAAVGAASSAQFLFFSLCVGMSIGIGIVIAQYFGAKDEEYVKRSIANSVYVMLGSSLIMSIIGFFLSMPMLRLLRTPENIINDADLYLKTLCLGFMAIAAYNCIAAILRALGDATTPLIFLTAAVVINIGLDLLFIIVCSMGVFGAAIATVISQTVAAAGAVVFALIKNEHFKMPLSYLKPNKDIIIKSVKMGLPVAFQNSMIAVSDVVIQGVVNSFGSSVIAAFTATTRIEQLVTQPYISLSSAVATFTGQNIGAGNIKRVKSGYRKSYIIIGIFTLCMMLPAQFLGEPIMRLFVDNAEVIALGTGALRITSLCYFPLGMIFITRGLLNGSGDTFFSFINGMIEVVCRIALTGPLCCINFIGVWGIWIAYAITWLITGLASWFRYLQGKWKDKSVVRSEFKKTTANV